jgi:hypothetical protein
MTNRDYAKLPNALMGVSNVPLVLSHSKVPSRLALFEWDFRTKRALSDLLPHSYLSYFIDKENARPAGAGGRWRAGGVLFWGPKH